MSCRRYSALSTHPEKVFSQLNNPQKVLLVEDVVNNTKDQLEFRDRVVKMSLGEFIVLKGVYIAVFYII